VSRDLRGPAEPAGPVLVGVLGTAPAEEALRYAFTEADHRGVALLVVLTGEAQHEDRVSQSDAVQRWAEKYPAVHATTTVGPHLDPAVVLVAASRGCSLLAVQQPSDPAGTALVDALQHRSHCPVVVCADRTTTQQAA
jgi:hypothetical protein